MTTFVIEHQCPQCGAPARLEESHRFFKCGFCRTNSYLTTIGFFRYRLPDNAPPGERLIYIPYWRFKGMLFSCLHRNMQEKFVDVSQLAVPSPHLPASLGFRSQTQILRFAVADDPDAVFIKPRMTAKELMQLLNDRFSADLPKPALIQEYIGESLSLIYAPYYQKGSLMDGILNEPLDSGDAATLTGLLNHKEPPRWPLTFVPALCPACGWDLKGENDALALACGHCMRVWHAKQDRLTDIHAIHLADREGAVYLPFWRIKADTTPVSLDSYADFIRIANLPKVPLTEWERLPFYYWAPAFKVRPQYYLTLATALTMVQMRGKWQAGQPPGRTHAVNMPLTEAVESMKLNLAGFMRPREHMIAQLPFVNIQPRGYRLIYLPFREGHHELIHDGMRLAISKNTLSQARNL